MKSIEHLLKKFPLGLTWTMAEEIREAKEIHKQEIIDAFKRGTINEMNGIEEITSEQYYNETFKNK